MSNDNLPVSPTPGGSERADLAFELEKALMNTDGHDFEISAAFVRELITALKSDPSEREEIVLLRRACDAAFAFIEAHVADPDITDEMRRKYADYKDARRAASASGFSHELSPGLVEAELTKDGKIKW